MTTREQPGRDHEALPPLLSRLSAAVLRISASLDVATVLREVVESARSLTGARYGIITTIDEAGAVQDFVASGLTPEEHRKLSTWRDAPRLFEHLRDLPGPLRLRDLPAYVRSRGFSSDLDIGEDIPGNADAPPGRARRQLLPRR